MSPEKSVISVCWKKNKKSDSTVCFSIDISAKTFTEELEGIVLHGDFLNFTEKSAYDENKTTEISPSNYFPSLGTKCSIFHAPLLLLYCLPRFKGIEAASAARRSIYVFFLLLERRMFL
ncbi:MAG: hypothetical protein ACQERN_07055 [Thermodesulfobacteriota bacterium]